MIKSESLNECIKQWVASEAPSLLSKIEVQEDEQRKRKSLTIAIDGKEIRSTRNMKKYNSALHIVSAQIGELALTPAQQTVQSKSNDVCWQSGAGKRPALRCIGAVHTRFRPHFMLIRFNKSVYLCTDSS